MANAFAPEIGIDIGASNVTPGQAASIDFSGLSGIAKIFGGGGSTARPTESDIQEIYLDPVVQDLEVVSQAENPIVREAQFRLIESRALQTVGARYANEVKTLVDRYRGVSTPPETTGAGASEALVADYSKTDAGKIDALYAEQKFKNQDGSVDYDGVYFHLYSKALESAKNKTDLELLTERVQKRNLTAQDGHGQYVAGRAVEFNNHFDTLLNTNAIVASAFDPNKSTTENVLAAKMLLQNEVAKYKAEDKVRLAGMGIDTSKGEFSTDPAYAVAEAKIQVLTSILDYPEMNTKELGQEQLANVVTRLNKISPGLGALFATEGGTEVAVKELMSIADIRNQLTAAFNEPDDVMESFNARSFLLGADPATGSNDMTLPVPADSRDLSRAQANVALSEFNPKFVEEYRSIPPAEQRTELDKTIKLVSSVTPENISTQGQAKALREKYLSPQYLMLASRSYQDYSDNNTMQTFYGEGALQKAEAVNKKSPVDGITLYKQMHKAMATEVKRLEIRLLQNFSSMFPADKNPLVLKESNGKIIIGIDENAVKSDRVLQMELSDIRSKMQNEQNAGYPTVTDPLFESKEAEVLVSRYNKLGLQFQGPMGSRPFDFGAGTGLQDIMKNMNFLYTQFGKMPKEIQDDPTFGRIVMLDVLENLPRYRVENTPLEVLENLPNATPQTGNQ